MSLNYLDSSKGSKASRSINEIGVKVPDEPILVGTITSTDLNDAPADGMIDIVYEGAKPEGKYIYELFFKNTETFVSYSTSVTIDKIELMANASIIGLTNSGDTYPTNLLDDITIQITLSQTNPQDWTSGNINVYASFVTYPNI